MTPWRLRAANTHLYPGARLRGTLPATQRGGYPVIIEFADGALATGQVEDTDADGPTLALDAWVTRRGALVTPRRWRLRPAPAADPSSAPAGTEWRVARRLIQ